MPQVQDQSEGDTVRIVCSWCRGFLGEKAGAPGVSHGICAECEANLFERITETIVYRETDSRVDSLTLGSRKPMARSYCPGSGNARQRPKRRKTLTGPQVQCPRCGRWLRQPRARPRSVPPHKAYRYVAPMDTPVSGT